MGEVAPQQIDKGYPGVLEPGISESEPEDSDDINHQKGITVVVKGQEYSEGSFLWESRSNYDNRCQSNRLGSLDSTSSGSGSLGEETPSKIIQLERVDFF